MNTLEKNGQKAWEDRYQSGQTGWDRGAASPAIFTWMEHKQLKPCRIFIPGCGRGYEVAILAERGFQVTAVDITTAAMVSVRGLLAQQGVSATLIQADLLQWEADFPFDAIYEQTSLCALPPETWDEYADRLWRWLKPGGQLFALFMQTDQPGGPPFHCGMDRMEILFPVRRWVWSEKTPMQVKHPSGRQELGYVLVRQEG